MLTNKELQATSKSERIPSLDFLRGIAILGILFINIENFALPNSWSPWKFGYNNSLDQDVRFWVYFLTQGKFYNMFALLFGVGFYIFLERLEKKGYGLKAMDIYARRLLWLFVIGILHAYLIWSGDVLYHYAICGLILFPFRSIQSKYLWIVILILIAAILHNSESQLSRRKSLFESYKQAIKIDETKRTKPDQKSIDKWLGITSKKEADTTYQAPPYKNYPEAIIERFEKAEAHKGLVYYKSLLFPSLIAMLIGIILYRSGIFSDYKVWKYYWLISLGLLAFALLINYQRYYQWTYEYNQPVLTRIEQYLFTFPKELLGVSYILVLNGLYQKYLIKIKPKFISAIGRMALSNYLLQNTLLGILFYGYGLGWYNQFSRSELIIIVISIWTFQIALSWIWLKKFNQGPVEWVWKRLTYQGFKN